MARYCWVQETELGPLKEGLQGVLGIRRKPNKDAWACHLSTTFIHDGNQYLFAGVSPGEYVNIMPINPKSIDSDLDAMPDGWEFVYGLRSYRPI